MAAETVDHLQLVIKGSETVNRWDGLTGALLNEE